MLYQKKRKIDGSIYLSKSLGPSEKCKRMIISFVTPTKRIEERDIKVENELNPNSSLISN